MSDFNINISTVEPENIIPNLSVKDKLNISFTKDIDNVMLLKSVCIDLFNKVSELEKTVKFLEKRNG